VRHHAHLITKRGNARVHRQPPGIPPRQVIRETDAQRRAMLGSTMIPNEPSCPATPLPSSYAQIGVGGRCGCSRRRICRCRSAYLPAAAGRATTIPAPGTGSGSRKRGSRSHGSATRAAAGRVDVNASADPPANP
jgi:hypothetical protein